ncbi:MAG TPA: UDP-N-acetylmuramate--L-alanine ligase [Coriobacteriia bacterium]|nr:UDP-N-acetylmuramate--L-alanine ligase [Coriobacteriia bacterium]
MRDGVYAHFIGVGGAGMSGIAKVLHERGTPVTGSDLKDSRYVRALREAGVSVVVGHDAEHLGAPSVVVVSSAVPETNPELTEARRRGIPVWPRAKMLAHLAEGRCTIAVAGTHGKTTTTSMIATMLARMGLDPTYLVGGEVSAFGTNAASGAGEHYVVEADESDGSLLHLAPHVAVITNIEADHLDHYGTIEAVERTFERFAERTGDAGFVVACADDPRAAALVSRCGSRVVSYGTADAAQVRCVDIVSTGAGHRFSVITPDERRVTASIPVPGAHNVLNATAALAVAYALGIDLAAAAEGLSQFAGVKRRFDRLGEVRGVSVVDDYAHHPTEVRATLAAARSHSEGRVWAVFQPHRYSRTAALAAEFGGAFGDADRLVLMEVYSAGEAPVPGVTGKTIVDEVLRSDPRTRVAYLPHPAEIPRYLATSVRSGDLVLTMGAGDVTALGPEIMRALGGEGT